MARVNAFLAQKEDEKEKTVDTALGIMKQFMMDTVQVAMGQEFGWGYDRIMRMTLAWQQIYDEFKPALNSRNAEADYLREKLDRLLQQICEGHQDLIPWRERYPETKEITYGRKKK